MDTVAFEKYLAAIKAAEERADAAIRGGMSHRAALEQATEDERAAYIAYEQEIAKDMAAEVAKTPSDEDAGDAMRMAALVDTL